MSSPAPSTSPRYWIERLTGIVALLVGATFLAATVSAAMSDQAETRQSIGRFFNGILFLPYGLALTSAPRRWGRWAIGAFLVSWGVLLMVFGLWGLTASALGASSTLTQVSKAIIAGLLWTAYGLLLLRGAGQGRAWPLLPLYQLGASPLGFFLAGVAAIHTRYQRRVRKELPPAAKSPPPDASVVSTSAGDPSRDL